MSLHTLESSSNDPFEYPGLQVEDIDFRYNLNPEQLSYLEHHLLRRFSAEHPDEQGVAVFLVQPDSPYADIARTTETRKFMNYDSSTAMRPYEDSSFFLYTVNLDEPVNEQGSRIAHIKRVVKAREARALTAETLGTGLEVVDDRLDAPVETERCGLTEIADAHGIKDFSKCMNVTSNMAVDGVMSSLDRPYTLISYKAVFEIGKHAGVSHLFAYINPAAYKSLSKKLGVRADLLAGKEFHLPNPNNPGEYFDDYRAYCMPYDEWNMAAFTELHPDYILRRLIANREVKIFEV